MDSVGITRITLATTNIEGWRQLGELGLALVLSSCIGVEREFRQKSAGLRTHTLVGVGAALFMLIGKYGFADVIHPGTVILDPSRMAAQIVSGVGFLGAGLIFVRGDGVRGLTTAAAVWVTAAIGTAAGAGLPLLAILATASYMLVILVFPPLVKRLPGSSNTTSVIRVRYLDGKGILRDVLADATGRGFAVSEVATRLCGQPLQRDPDGLGGSAGPPTSRSTVEVTMRVQGKSPISELAASLAELGGVQTVLAGSGE